MYSVDDQDLVIPFLGVPHHDPGAPLPIVLASDNDLVIGYHTASLTSDEYATVQFHGAIAHYFGSPNDEALTGHPLAARGLGSYGVFEVVRSSWIRSLERMNRVHHLHRPERFEALRHFIFTFRDTTFECVADEVARWSASDNRSSAIAMARRWMTHRR
jgi:hypothetical protein